MTLERILEQLEGEVERVSIPPSESPIIPPGLFTRELLRRGCRDRKLWSSLRSFFTRDLFNSTSSSYGTRFHIFGWSAQSFCHTNSILVIVCRVVTLSPVIVWSHFYV